MTLTDFIAHASMKNVAFSVYIVINSNLAGVAPLDITHPRMRKIEEGQKMLGKVIWYFVLLGNKQAQ